MTSFDIMVTRALRHFDLDFPDVASGLRVDAANLTRWIVTGKGSVPPSLSGPGGLYEQATRWLRRHGAKSGAYRCKYGEALDFVDGWLRRNIAI